MSVTLRSKQSSHAREIPGALNPRVYEGGVLLLSGSILLL